MANNRIFYAVQRAGISTIDSVDFSTIRGLQTIGTTTTFSLEQAFEIGQLQIYENIEGIPDVEVTIEKVLDGYSPVYLMATQADINETPPTSATLVGRSQGICKMAISTYDETNQYALGTPGAEVHMSGLYVSSVGYSVTVNDNATESCSLVGNNKVWVIGGDTGNFVGYDTTPANWLDSPWTGGDESPKSINGSGGVNRREDILFGDNGTLYSVLPTNIPGITSEGYNVHDGNSFPAHIQSWDINCNLGREQLFELGSRATYYRYATFPVEVTNEISVISVSGDLISATEEGIYGSDEGCGNRNNLTDQSIVLRMCEGLVVDCGEKNKLSSVSVTGGDAGGGNVEVTYSYSNFNDFTVQHSSDPVEALQPVI